ncbi:MAG: hypothetical protein QOH16_683 [Gaiellaceae bacterium]|nr:hypothetical protein [Gaiellaceae bacterium]
MLSVTRKIMERDEGSVAFEKLGVSGRAPPRRLSNRVDGKAGKVDGKAGNLRRPMRSPSHAFTGDRDRAWRPGSLENHVVLMDKESECVDRQIDGVGSRVQPCHDTILLMASYGVCLGQGEGVFHEVVKSRFHDKACPDHRGLHLVMSGVFGPLRP